MTYKNYSKLWNVNNFLKCNSFVETFDNFSSSFCLDAIMRCIYYHFLKIFQYQGSHCSLHFFRVTPVWKVLIASKIVSLVHVTHECMSSFFPTKLVSKVMYSWQILFCLHSKLELLLLFALNPVFINIKNEREREREREREISCKLGVTRNFKQPFLAMAGINGRYDAVKQIPKNGLFCFALYTQKIHPFLCGSIVQSDGRYFDYLF